MSTERSSSTVVCPNCESGALRPAVRLSMRCNSCGLVMAGPMLRTLLDIVSLPEPGAALPPGEFHPPLTGDGRSGWVDFYLTQYRRILGPKWNVGDERGT